MEIFKGDKTYVVMPKSMTRGQAIKEANKYFKIKNESLEIQSGKMIDEETIKIGKTGTHWVVSRKGKR